MASEPKRLNEATEQTVGVTEPTLDEIRLSVRRIWSVLEYSSVYLAFIAMAKISIVLFVLSLPLSWAPGVAGLITFAIYVNDRLADAETDRASHPQRTAFVYRHSDSLYVLAAIAYGLGVALSVLGGPVAFFLAVLPGAAWIAYAGSWMPASGLNIQRLKDILLVNSTLVAAAWAIPIVIVPVAFADAALTPTAGVLILYFFLGTFVNAEIANARDMENDRKNGVRTMPVVLGIPRTRQLLYGITITTVIVLGYAGIYGYIAPTTTAILAAGPVLLLGVVALLGRVENNDLLALSAECTRVPVFLLLTGFVLLL